MKFKDNPYYNPEKCGLEIFEQVDTGGHYEYDMLVIWRKLDDFTLWYDTDAGCSCPTPFDDYRHDLKPITKDTLYGFNQALENHTDISREHINKIYNNVKQFLIINE